MDIASTVYQTTIDDESVDVRVQQLDNTRLRVTIDGDEQIVDVTRMGPKTFTIRDKSSVFTVCYVRHSDNTNVFIDNQPFRVQVLNERQRSLRRRLGSQASGGQQLIVSPMPGKVVKILKSIGDEVAEGDGVIVVEAMKMENELRAQSNGVVTAIAVSAGQTVDGGELLLTIDPPAEESE